jgi:hypothetical protein
VVIRLIKLRRIAGEHAGDAFVEHTAKRSSQTLNRYAPSAALRPSSMMPPATKGRLAARSGLSQFIEGFYNCHRLHSAIGYMTPMQKEQLAAAA